MSTNGKTGRFDKAASFLGLVTSNIGTLVILIVVGHFAIGLLWGMKEGAQGKYYDPRFETPLYENFEDIATLARESVESRRQMKFRPHVIWRSDPYEGRYVNVDAQGQRKTIKSPAPDAKKVFMMGGSTMWGEGSPDDGTIPSHLQQILGEGYDVYNMGETGYTSVQELNYLMDQLSRGNIPDIVVFYDGVNDGFTYVYSPGEPRSIHEPEKMVGFRPQAQTLSGAFIDLYRHSEYRHLDRLAKLFSGGGRKADTPWDEQIRPKIDANVRQTLDHYEAFMKQANALADAYGFEVYYFWQPNLFSDRRPILGHEDRILQDASPTWVDSQKALYKAAREHFTGRNNEKVFYIGDIFDDLGRPVYIDWCHISPDANRMVAQAMYRHITQKQE